MPEGRLLGVDKGRHHAQESFQLVAGRQLAQPRGAAHEDGREIGRPDAIALGDLAQRVFAVT